MFGLGAILCEILTGYPPYVGRSREEVYRQARAGDQAEMSARLEACGAEAALVALARTCLAPEPSDRPADAKGVALPPLTRRVDARGYHYDHVDVAFDRERRVATVTVASPGADQPRDLAGILALGAQWWPLALARELDDAILLLRTKSLITATPSR